MLDVQAHVVDGPAVLFGRFHPFNIMHALHDDILALFYLLRQYLPLQPYVNRSPPGVPTAQQANARHVSMLTLSQHAWLVIMSQSTRSDPVTAPFSRSATLWLWDPHGPATYDLLFGQFTDRYAVDRPALAAAARRG